MNRRKYLQKCGQKGFNMQRIQITHTTQYKKIIKWSEDLNRYIPQKTYK